MTPIPEYKPKLLMGARLLVNNETNPIAVVVEASAQGNSACLKARPVAPRSPRARTSSR